MKYLSSIVLFFCAAGLYAAPLGVGWSMSPLEMRQSVIAAAIRYENTPYVWGGMTSRGLDCSGFIVLSFRDAFDVTLPRTTMALYTWSERITLDVSQPGDLLFFRTTAAGNISHVALYLGSGRFIHSASAGPRTGVIVSSLNEPYWARAYAGAGRVLPAASPGAFDRGFDAGTSSASAGGAQSPSGGRRGASHSESRWDIMLGVGIAPTWNFVLGGDLFRGFTSHIHLGAATNIFGTRVIFGVELRPDYDGALGVFRLPATLSLGFNTFTLYGGPVLSIGEASLDGGDRRYGGGTSWFGAAGLIITPHRINTRIGEFAPFFEIAWQSYSHEGENDNFWADFRASTRFSTGIRWAMRIR